jgi:hypothetical protein
MFRSTIQQLSLVALLVGVGCSSGTTTMQGGDPLCSRQRDIEMRCAPARGACLFMLDYNYCVSTEPVYRPEYATTYMNCYPDNIGCDTASTSAADTCVYMASTKIAVDNALSTLINNICSRCPGYANDGTMDAATCAMNTMNITTYPAQALRFFTDDSLNKLNSCIVAASPPADGCVAYTQCYQNLLPPVSAKSCGDGGV